MKVTSLIETIGSDFYSGVPDSQFRALCDFLIDKYGTDPNHHIIAANEGNAVALAAGYHLIEAKCSIGARADLGRPTTTARENIKNYMQYLNSKAK